MSYLTELHDICDEILEEGWGGLAMDKPPVRNIKTPQETTMSLSYKGNRIGGPEMNLAKMSASSGQNPYEQEEVFGSIDKGELFDIIDELSEELDNKSHQDQVALMILGKLKKKLSQ